MPFQIIHENITKVKADAIVNTANPKPIVGRGTDHMIYEAAGYSSLLAERQKIGDILPGQCACTSAFALDAKYIIHAVGPKWIDGNHGEKSTLYSCYETSLALADHLRCESIAFPLISAGVYGFPKAEALSIAISAIRSFLFTHDMDVLLVVFDREAFALSAEVHSRIDKFIDEHYVSEQEHAPKRADRADRRLASMSFSGMSDSGFAPSAAPSAAPRSSAGRRTEKNRLFSHRPAKKEKEPENQSCEDSVCGSISAAPSSLEEVLETHEDTFQQRLLRLIDESGMTDVAVYKRANIDRKLFSHIRCNPNYRPKKKTALAFAIALKLDMPTTLDLLSRAEIALSPSSKADIIITYFIQNGIYDIFEINAALFQYEQPTLDA